MFIILAETHKIIAEKIYENVQKRYNLNLDLDKLKWGSIAPDYLPYYKLHRHYYDESIEFIVNEIISLIYISRYVDLYEMKPVFRKYFSKKLGIISHYICDFTCLPHANRIAFTKNMRQHIKYENDLNEFAKIFKFNKSEINIYNIKIEDEVTLREQIVSYIENAISLYKSKESSYSKDLNFGLSLSNFIVDFILESVFSYCGEIEVQLV